MTDALQKYLDEVRAKPFDWRTHNCAHLVAGAWDACVHSGSLYWRGALQSLHVVSGAAYRRAQRRGQSLYGLTVQVLGEPISDVPERGDAVLLRNGSQTILGVAVPPLALVAGKSGTEALPLGLAIATWRRR